MTSGSQTIPDARPPVSRIWIECTRTWFRGGNTGIQRVVRNVVREAAEAGPRRGVACQPLVWAGFGAVRPRRALGTRPHWVSDLRDYLHEVAVAAFGLAGALLPASIARLLGRLGSGQRRLARLGAWLSDKADVLVHGLAGAVSFPRELLLGRRVELGPSDLLLLLDAGWGIRGVERLVAEARARGARIGLVVYDLIPLEEPAAVSPMTRPFRSYLDGMLGEVDFVLAISDATRVRVLERMRGSARPRSLRTGVFRLGAELDLTGPAGGVREAVSEVLGDGGSLYLSVGTIEPRKNQGVTLDAFESLWDRGAEVRLLLVGREGFRSEYLIERIRFHPELGRRLFFFDDLDDTELDAAYGRARAVVSASFAEGFGLPLVEALAHRVPVFASDIPAHREVAGKHCVYFDRRNPTELTAAIEAFEASGELPPDVAPPEAFHWPDWWESTVELLDEVLRLSEPRPPADDAVR